MITGRDLRRARESRGVSLYKLAEQIGKSVSHLSRVERDADGRHPGPNVIYLYESALGVKVAATVEPVHTGTPGSNVEDVNRRDMLTATSTVALAASAAFVLPPKRARKVRPEDVHQVTVAISAFNSWDHAFGGGHARQVGKPHLNWAFTLLDDDCEQALRPKLFGAVGGLAAAGFMAFDAFQHQQARDYFDFALDCAIQANDDNLHARVLSSMARQAVWCGRPKEAIGYMDQALAKRARHTATELTSLMKSQRAQTELMVLRTHASQTGDAGQLIERIDEAVADAAR